MLKETNTPTRPRIEPGSPDPESDALTIRPVCPPNLKVTASSSQLHCYIVDIHIKGRPSSSIRGFNTDYGKCTVHVISILQMDIYTAGNHVIHNIYHVDKMSTIHGHFRRACGTFS